MSTADGTESSSTDGNETGGTTSTAGDEFKPITSQDDLNRVIADRVQRERAKYADYKDVKTKAAEYDKLAEANKSEIEKANDRVTKAEAEVAKVPTLVADALRTHLIARHEIDKDDAELFLTASEPELLLKQVDRLLAQGAPQRKTNHVTREGNNPSADERAEAAVVRQLFAGD